MSDGGLNRPKAFIGKGLAATADESGSTEFIGRWELAYVECH